MYSQGKTLTDIYDKTGVRSRSLTEIITSNDKAKRQEIGAKVRPTLYLASNISEKNRNMDYFRNLKKHDDVELVVINANNRNRIKGKIIYKDHKLLTLIRKNGVPESFNINSFAGGYVQKYTTTEEEIQWEKSSSQPYVQESTTKMQKLLGLKA